MRLLAWIAVLLLVFPSALAMQANIESAGLGRIVGDSPDELLAQLNAGDVELRHATYESMWNPENSSVQGVYDVNITIGSYFGQNYIPPSGIWLWANVRENVKRFSKNELFIVETDGSINENLVEAENGMPVFGETISPAGIESWKGPFKESKPLFVFDSDYAGTYFPKGFEGTNSFVGQLGQDSVFVAPTAMNERELVKSFVCSIGSQGNGASVGDMFREARNAFYWQGSSPSALFLMSYELYGNPLVKVSLQRADRSSLIESCKPYTQNSSANSPMQLSALSITSSDEPPYAFQNAVVISNYSTHAENNFTILDIQGMSQARTADSIMLPYSVQVHEFPPGTAISNASTLALEEPVDLTLDLPVWNGSSASERICWSENKSAGVSFVQLSETESEKIIAQVSPVEIINCTAGHIRLYRRISYMIGYAPGSSVMIKSAIYPESAIPGIVYSVNSTLKSMMQGAVSGELSLSANGAVINSTTVSLQRYEQKTVALWFLPNDSSTEYELAYSENGTRTSKKLIIYPDPLSIRMSMPESGAAGLPFHVTLQIYNQLSYPINAVIDSYLVSNGTSIKPLRLPTNLQPGENTAFIKLENLTQGHYIIRSSASTKYGTNTKIKPFEIFSTPYTSSSGTVSGFSDGSTQNQTSGVVNIPRNAFIKNATIKVSGTSSPVNVTVLVGNSTAARIIGKLEGDTAVIDTFSNGKPSETLSSAESSIVTRTISAPKSSSIQSVTLNIGTVHVPASMIAAESEPELQQTSAINASSYPEAFTANITAINSSGNRTNMTIQATAGTYCSDRSFNNDILTINLGLYCANDWKTADINNDGQTEYYLITGTTHTMWSSCEGESIGDYRVRGWADRNFNRWLGCTYDSDRDLRISTSYCDSALEHTYYDQTYSSPTLTMQAKDMLCDVKSNDWGDEWYYGWWSDAMILKDPSGRNRIVVNCGVDNDCANDKYCKKPTISNPTTYSCDTPTCANLNCPEWKTQQNTYSNHQCNSQCTLNTGRCETPGAEIDDTHYCDSNHYIQSGVKKKITANGNIIWTGFGYKTETVNLTSQFRDVIKNCVEDSQGLCSIPIQFMSDFSQWELKINGVYASYTPVFDMSNEIQNQLNICNANACGITISAVPQGAGTAAISSPSIKYELYDYAPVVTLNEEVNISEGETANLNLNAFDIAGDNLTAAFSSPFNSSDLWRTNYSSSGTYTVNATVSDGTYLVTKTSKVSVSNVNTFPIMEFIDGKYAIEGENVTINASAYDPDGDTLSYSINDTRFETSQNSFTWQTKKGDEGNYSINISASDGKNSVSQTVEATVSKVANIPPLIQPILNITVTEGQTAIANINASDTDNDNLTVTFSNPLNASGMWKTNHSTAGTYAVSATASDGTDNSTASFYIHIINENRQPRIHANNISISEGEHLILTASQANLTADGESPYTDNPSQACGQEQGKVYACATISDPDNENSATNDDNSITAAFSYPINQSGEWKTNYTSAGTYTTLITISDGEFVIAKNITITVANTNRHPALSITGNESLTEGETAAFTLNATDPDGDTIAYFTNDSRLSQINNTFQWNTTKGDKGEYSIMFGATDGLDNTTITVSLIVARIAAGMALTIQSPQNNTTTNSSVVWIIASTGTESACYYQQTTCASACAEYSQRMFAVTNSTAHLQKLNTTEEGNYTINVLCNNSESSNATTLHFTASRTPHIAVDLVLGNASASHECNGTNITATLAAQITNTAEQPLNFSIKWQLDNFSAETRETEVTGTITRQHTRNTTAGNHTFRVEADSRLEINETDEPNNAAEISFTINYTCAETGGNYSNTTINQTNTTVNQSNASATLPDLMQTSIIPIVTGRIILNSSDYYSGDSIFFDSGISNMGGTNTGVFNIKWFVDGNMTGYGSHLGVQNMTTELNGNSQYTWTATAGQHNITFVVDADNHVSESNETNNQITYSLIVMETSPYVPLQDAMLNGQWLKKGGNYTTTNYGTGGHAMIVLNNTPTTDGIITVQLKLPHQNAESGLCARMNLSGYGYCLGTAWGGEQKLVISYFSGHPYAPEYISGTYISMNATTPITLKIMLNGTNIKGKAYNTGQPEPEWQVQVQDSRFQTGNTAYYTYYSPAEFYKV